MNAPLLPKQFRQSQLTGCVKALCSMARLPNKKDSLDILERRWNLKKKFHSLDNSAVSNIFSLYEISPSKVLEDKSFDEILIMHHPKEHLKIGLALEIMLSNLKANHLSLCDFNCAGCETLNEKVKKCDYITLRIRYNLCPESHAIHLECDPDTLKECKVCGSKEVLTALKETSRQALAILSYMKNRRERIEAEFKATCAFQAASFIEAAKMMHKKNSIITANDSGFEEVFSLICANKELLTGLLGKLKYNLFNLEDLKVVSELENFSLTPKQILHLDAMRKTTSISIAVENERWKALPSEERMKAFLVKAKKLLGKHQ